MAKKDFSSAAANAFVSKMTNTETAAAEPKQKKTAATATKPAKAPEEYITMILDSLAVEKMRTIAWQDKRKLKAVFMDAIQMYIADYEAKHGTIPTR